jgi:catechol 2,3-dioxygenase-like lactoylglutathione lyase family enzyme
VKALWAPLEVESLAPAVDFYRALGLRVLSRFEGGVVFETGPGGRLEVVAPRTPSPPPPVALELAAWAEVDTAYRQVGGDAPPAVLPRGHYGFVARDPDGNPLLIWSEA